MSHRIPAHTTPTYAIPAYAIPAYAIPAYAIPAYALLILALSLSVLNAEPAEAQSTQNDVYDHATMVLQVVEPGGSSATVMLMGTCSMEMLYDGPAVGDADDDDANLLDEIDFNLDDLHMWGQSPSLGRVDIFMDDLAGWSGGFLEETVDLTTGRLDLPPHAPTGSAECFLDLNFAMMFMGQAFYSNAPYRISGPWNGQPAAPGDEMYGSGYTNLYDSNGSLTGWLIRVDALRLNSTVLENRYAHTVVMLELLSPGGSIETIQLRGPSTMLTLFESPLMGNARDDDFDGLDEVNARLAGLSLHGVSSMYGPAELRLRTSKPANGEIEELVNVSTGELDVEPFTPGTEANSFFDIYFELDVGGLQLATSDPHRLSGVLTHLPASPGDGFAGSGLVPLHDYDMNPTGFALRIDHCRFNPPLERDLFERVTAEIELIYPTGGRESVVLSGTAIVEALFEGAVMGAASDDDHNGRDDISTEIVALDLTGTSGLGPFELHLNPEFRSVGQIEEQVDLLSWWLDLPPFTDNQIANSFFDVFVEVDVGEGDVSGPSADPLRIDGVVTYKPSGQEDQLYGSRTVDILDELGRPNGYQILFRELQLGPISTPVGADIPPSLGSVQLRAAPNPFNPRVQVSVMVPRSGLATLRVYDARGRLVSTLHEGMLSGGERSFIWDGRDGRGRAVVSGSYHLQLTHADGKASRKVTLVR